MKIVTETRQEEENRSKEFSIELKLAQAALTEVRQSFGVHFDSALELVIRALTPWPNRLKTVGLKS